MSEARNIDSDCAERVVDVRNLNYTYAGNPNPPLKDVVCSYGRGARVLVGGCNGAGKSTLLSILGGKKMIAKQSALVLGKEAFHDSILGSMVTYCGDWWRTEFFFNITVRELMGQSLENARVQRLIEILQVDLSWRINAISDGQRRRCQLLESLQHEHDVYLLDEITTDLDLQAREGLLAFLKSESEERGATILYCTHIFDHLEGWATHMLYFSQGRVKRCCAFEDFSEYHALVASGERCPLYTLMKSWVFKEYSAPVDMQQCGDEAAPGFSGPFIDVKNLAFSYAKGLPPVIRDMSFSFYRGDRVLVVGANGACKSTIMSILGGRRLMPRGQASVLGKDAFNDTDLSLEVMYCGDWWRTKFFMNITIRELLAESATTARCAYLSNVLQVDLGWKINNLSDGQRRRCQLLETLVHPRSVLLMDEITTDLDLYARCGILSFLRAESELRGCTVFYCTHIFDHLEGWANKIMHLAHGEVQRCCPLDEVAEYNDLINRGVRSPLYQLVRRWIHEEDEGQLEKRRRIEEADNLDGRIPNLGLAGPMQMMSG
jgi:CCR4-NOT complex subunit CAF16